MNLAKRLEAIETALAKEYGGTIKLLLLRDGETEEQARERAGLTACPVRTAVVFLSQTDARL